MLRPKNWSKPIPATVRNAYRGRIYWTTYWGGGLWTVEPDDDIERMVTCNGNSREAIDTYEEAI